MTESGRKWADAVRSAIVTSVIGALVGLALWYAVVEVRLARVEVVQASHAGEIRKLDDTKASKESVQTLERALVRIEAKLDALIVRERR
jgi:hypothetical protein